MQLSKLSRDDKTQAGSTVLSGTATVDLTETLKERLRFFVREAAPSVYNLELDEYFRLFSNLIRVVQHSAPDEDFADLCELDGVADDVEKDLSDAEAVDLDLWRHV